MSCTVLYFTILEYNTLRLHLSTRINLEKRLIQKMLLFTNIWRHPILLGHANPDDNDMRYTSTSKTTNDNGDISCFFHSQILNDTNQRSLNFSDNKSHVLHELLCNKNL
jgi:hypothetical protein